MIRRVEVLYFKGFKHVAIDLKPYNILVGPNESGKSTFLDIFALLKDVFDYGPSPAIRKRCSQFRELVWNQERDVFEIAVEFKIPPGLNKEFDLARYEISMAKKESEGIIIDNENLWLVEKDTEKRKRKRKPTQLSLFPREPSPPEHIILYRKRKPQGWKNVLSKSPSGNDYFRSEETDWNITYRFGPHQASLSRIPEDERKFPISLWVRKIIMEGIQFVQLNNSDMRWPCGPDISFPLRPDCHNLPRTIEHMKQSHRESYERWLEHLKNTLRGLADIGIKERTRDRFLYLCLRYLNGMEIPSWLLSEGTLRLLALTLIAYLKEKDRIYLIEELENGLHPDAVESLIQCLSASRNQLVMTTNSPLVVKLSDPENILCFSKTDTGAIDMVAGEKHPTLKDWQDEADLASLHASEIFRQ